MYYQNNANVKIAWIETRIKKIHFLF